MQNLESFTVSQLAELRGQTRMNIAVLERKGALRTVQESIDLSTQRALLIRLTRTIKTRIVQLPLF